MHEAEKDRLGLTPSEIPEKLVERRRRARWSPCVRLCAAPPLQLADEDALVGDVHEQVRLAALPEDFALSGPLERAVEDPQHYVAQVFLLKLSKRRGRRLEEEPDLTEFRQNL